jgi:hypothetical protein
MLRRLETPRPVLCTIVDDDVELTREHARAIVRLLLPDIKRRMAEERPSLVKGAAA